MTRASDPPVDGDRLESSLDAELGRILEAYLADLEAGRPVDPDRLLAEHPSLAGPLRSCLAVVNLADRVADGGGDEPAARSGAISMPRAPGVLSTWDRRDGPPPRVHLHDLADDEPLVRPGFPAMPPLPEGSWGRYQLQGEIARGGMGAVIKGRDADLGRDLAIKVLLESHRGSPEIVRRFIEEAQIGGQLQHPGIVPVYELGTCADRRPYFAMKLVKGRTLASMLQARPEPRQDLPRFLSIFEQICQTMAYAHARGVIHRDLKPSNVMVGSFGEVQVMDWGLAKVLARGGVADEATTAAEPLVETVVMTVRSGPAGSGSESQAGSVLGTPAYMAPEQARGDIERLDERADVFGLGAILCEILTGRPPFSGATREEIRDRAARGDLAVAMVRLDACGADAELVALAKGCLAAEPERRPRDAGEVSRRMTDYQAGVQDRLKAAELARVEAQARAEGERKRRRVTMALAASVLGLVVLGGGGSAYLARQRLERAARVDRASSGVELLYAEADRAGDDPTRWVAAREAALALKELLADAPDRPTRDRLSGLVSDVTRAAAAAAADQALLAKLIDIRGTRGDDGVGSSRDAAYEEAFHEYRIDVSSGSTIDTVASIRSRPASVRSAIAAALDDWANLDRGNGGVPRGRLTDLAGLVDTDPWRNRLREVLVASPADRAEILKGLARSARIQELPAVSLHLLGGSLLDLGDRDGALIVLREAHRLHPGDVWINHILALCLEGSGRREEAIRYYMAARSIRPAMGHSLAHALERNGEPDQAIAVLQDVARLEPRKSSHLVCLSRILKDRGRTQEASSVLDSAIGVARAAVALKPDQPALRFDLGLALASRGDREGAISQYREAIRLKPGHAQAHNNLAASLVQRGETEEAIAEYRETLRLKPGEPETHFALGNLLEEQGKLDEAAAEYRTAARLKPDFADARSNLGGVLFPLGSRDEAIAEFHEALRLRPDHAEAHVGLGVILVATGKLEEAIAEFREAVRLKPELAEAHINLGMALSRKDRPDEAIAAYREGLRLKPGIAQAQYLFGHALLTRGRLDEAITAYHAALHIKPDYTDACLELGIALMRKGALDEAIAVYRDALRARPDWAEGYNNLGNALRNQGKRPEAVDAYRKALRIKPDLFQAHLGLGNALKDLGKGDEAIDAYRAVLRLKPDYAEAHCNLGLILQKKGMYADALDALRRGHELGAKRSGWSYPSAQWVRKAERMVVLDGRLAAILKGEARPADAAERLTLAEMCSTKHRDALAARFWEEAFQADAKLATDLLSANRYNAACAAASAGCGRSQDDPPLDEPTKARWRRQAVDWLKADLASWSRVLEKGLPRERDFVVRVLQHSRIDDELAGLREPAALARLPDDEQKACRALWAEVDALLKQVGETKQ